MRAKLGILAIAVILAMVLAFCALTDETDAPAERGRGGPGPGAIGLTLLAP
jgi:hypothetical protein